MSKFVILEVLDDGCTTRPVADGATLLEAIILGLERLDTVDIHELQANYLPRARQQALASEQRTRRVRLAEAEKADAFRQVCEREDRTGKGTHIVQVGEIQRELNKALAEEFIEQGTMDRAG